MFERVDVDADRLVGDLVGFLDIGLDGRGALGGFCLGFLGCWSGFRRGRRCGLLGDRGRRGFGRGRGFGLGLAEGALEVVERDFAGTQRAFQHLLDQRA